MNSPMNGWSMRSKGRANRLLSPNMRGENNARPDSAARTKAIRRNPMIVRSFALYRHDGVARCGDRGPTHQGCDRCSFEGVLSWQFLSVVTAAVLASRRRPSSPSSGSFGPTRM